MKKNVLSRAFFPHNATQCAERMAGMERTLHDLIRIFKKAIMRILLFSLRLFPVYHNRILLCNDLSYKYACNTKYIAEYLLQNYKDLYEIIYIVNDINSYDTVKKLGMNPVMKNAVRRYFYEMTAKVVITNNGGISFFPLRKSQYVINTFHGGGAYKKIGSAPDHATKFYKYDMMLSHRSIDVMLSTCDRFTEVMNRSLYIPREKFWHIGMPRNDMLINPDVEKKERIRRKIGLKEEERLVLFAPTYRAVTPLRESVDIPYGINPLKIKQAFERRFGGSWYFAYRLHPRFKSVGNFLGDGVISLTEYDDIQELLYVADALITDFSSIMWDFMLTKKPCFIFAVDLKDYIQKTGLYTPISMWPYSIAENNDDLEKNIMNFNEEQYLEKCKKHYEQLGGCETGCATQLVCERIYQVCFDNA